MALGTIRADTPVLRFGYARVSTFDQNPELQLNALRAAGITDDHLFVDRGVSGAKMHRPELDNVLSRLRTGDELVVWKLDRLGRSLRHLLEILDDLERQGIRFCSLTESLETATPMGRVMVVILGAFAQFERDIARERVLAGIAAARAKGRRGGRPKTVRAEQLAMARRLLDEGETVSDAARACGLPRQTLYRYHITRRTS